MITGHERKTNHLAPARMSAPCASHCYPALLHISTAKRLMPYIEQPIQYIENISITEFNISAKHILAVTCHLIVRFAKAAKKPRVAPVPDANIANSIHMLPAQVGFMPTAINRTARQSETNTIANVAIPIPKDLDAGLGPPIVPGDW